MARRIDIELTSSRPDGSWTWRAAGALQPRGTLLADLLPEGSKVGDVVRADAEFEIDGITVVAVLPPKERRRSEPERIELLRPTEAGPGVTTQLVGRGDRRRPGRDRRPPREDGRPDGPGPRRDRSPSAERDRDAGARRDGPRGQAREGARGPARDAARGRGGDDAGGGRGDDRRARPDAPRRPGATERTGEGRGEPRATGGPAAPSRGARRLNPASTHRQAVLEALPPEQRPVAEQVLRGGIPAVRTAIHLEREKAAAEGRPAPQAQSLVALAEDLLPRLRAAEWRDRAEAAAKVADEIALRDLRSVVAGGDVARDDETRALAAALREALERRLTRGREQWLNEVGGHLDEGRTVRALRLASRPPDTSARLPAALAGRLAESAGAALAPETGGDRWAAVLDAVVASPVRRQVKPAGLPADASSEVLSAARQQVGRVPALAPLLGISMPPPPGPTRPGAPAPASRRRPRSARAGATGGRPPSPTEPATGTTAAPPESAGERPPGGGGSAAPAPATPTGGSDGPAAGAAPEPRPEPGEAATAAAAGDLATAGDPAPAAGTTDAAAPDPPAADSGPREPAPLDATG